MLRHRRVGAQGLADFGNRGGAAFIAGDVAADEVCDYAMLMGQRFGEGPGLARWLAASEIQANGIHTGARKLARGGGAEARGSAEDHTPTAVQIICHCPYYPENPFSTAATLTPSGAMA